MGDFKIKTWPDFFAMIFLFVIFLLIFGVLGIFLWPYSINAWLTYFDKQASVTGLQGFLLGLIPGLGQIMIIVALVTWVLMLFLR